MLYKKLGKYFESVEHYLKIMKESIDLEKVKFEIYLAQKNKWTTSFCLNNPKQMPMSSKFDQSFKRVMKICKKNHGEVDIGKEEQIWYIVLDALFAVKKHPTVASKRFCNQFFNKRIGIFVQTMVAVIPFKQFLDSYLFKKQKDVMFKDMEQVIEGIFNDTASEQIVLHNANNASFNVNTQLFSNYLS